MTDDTRLDADLRAAAPTPAADRCTLAPEVFDLGRIMAWRIAASPDPAVDAHLATCAFCRSLLPGLAVVQTDAMTRALADRAPRRRARWPIAAAVAACAAAVLVLALRPSTQLDFDSFQVAQPGPAYAEGTLSGGLATVKAQSDSDRFTPASRLRWLLRPASTQARAKAARLYRLVDDRLTPVPATARINPRTGAAIIELAPIGDRLPMGTLELVAVLSWGDAPDLTGTRRARLSAVPGLTWRTRKITLTASSD